MVVHSASGNNTWVDYPSTSTQITATALENIENTLDVPFACMRRYRNGAQTSLVDGVVADVALNATDASVSRGSGLSASGNGIAVAAASLCLVTFEVLFLNGTFGSRAIQISLNGTIVRASADISQTTIRYSGSAIINVPAAGVITMQYYVFTGTTPTIGGTSSADTGLTVLRLTK